MPVNHQQAPSLASLINMDILRRAGIVAVLLGSTLVLANQSGAIFGDDTVQVLPLALAYLTPFIVVTISQVLVLRRAARDARSPRSFARHDTAFLATAMSHGIPGRALLVALAVGIANTSIVASSVLIASGSLANLPTAVIAQAFVLPLLFGLLSQTIAYRRAVPAIGEQLRSAPHALST